METAGRRSAQAEMNRPLAVAPICLAIFGCAAPVVWQKVGGTAEEFERDKNQCIYEANAATASYSQGQTARTRSGAIAQGFGEGLTMALRQRELAVLCMRARGYYPAPAPTPTHYVEQQPTSTGTASRAEPPPVRPAPVIVPASRSVGGDAYSRMNQQVEAPTAAPAKIGKFTYEAEQLAKSEQCAPSPTATLTASGAGFENFSIPCSNGDALAVRCEMGNCRSLK